MAEPTISVSGEEMLTARDLSREFAGRMKELGEGKVEKLVLTRHGKMVGVVLTVEDYARLTQGG